MPAFFATSAIVARAGGGAKAGGEDLLRMIAETSLSHPT
jgi:hypothetical protein